MNLRNHKEWDDKNGLLSVSLEPRLNVEESEVFVMLNGAVGNFCLDYSEDDFVKEIAMQRAWSSDTGYYVKVLADKVKLVRWWDGKVESIHNQLVAEKPQQFYKAITKNHPTTGTIVSFAKETFVKLRNCIQERQNGQASLRMFMYLLAALDGHDEKPSNVDKDKWHLTDFDPNWISSSDWEWLYESFQKGIWGSSENIRPLVHLVLRHASNRLFQEAHREANRFDFQLAMFGGTSRNYDSDVSDGAFYTPTPLVRTIVQEALIALDKAQPLHERASLKIFDPACGSAEFLREALRQLKMVGYAGTIQVVGWDKSEIACEISRFVLQYENKTEWSGNVSIEVLKRDSLEYNWLENGEADILLMNPPFTAFERLGERKTLIQEGLKGLFKRQPDEAALFWKKAAETVSEKGVLGLVLPHSLLGAETYQLLRAYLKEELEFDFSLIGRLGSAGLFEKAMIIPSILIGAKKTMLRQHTVLWTDFQQTSVYEALRELRKYRLSEIPIPKVEDSYSIYENWKLTDCNVSENWTVRSYQVSQIEEQLIGFKKVGDLFNVTRGADAGNNAAFVLKRENWELLPKNERNYFMPCVMRESIKDGRLNDSYYLFYPYGKYSISSKEEIQQMLPTYYSRILSKEEAKLKARTNFETKWWELNRPRAEEVQKSPKLISAYFGKSGYFAFDAEGKYLVGQSFAWLPKKEDLKEKRFQFAYLALLHAPLIDKLLELVCNVLDGGFYDLSKHYVDKMPMPELSKVNADILNYLTLTGEKIHNGESIDKEALNQAVANIYGLNIGNLI